MSEVRQETITVDEALPTKFQISERIEFSGNPGRITGVAFRTVGQTIDADTPVKVYYIVRMFDGSVRELPGHLLSYPESKQ